MITTFRPETPATRWNHLKGILLMLGSLILAHTAGIWSKYFEEWMTYVFALSYIILLIFTFAKKIILSFEVNEFTQTLTIHYFRFLTAPSFIVIPFENLRYQFSITNRGSKNESWYFSIYRKKWRIVANSAGEDGFDKELFTSLQKKLDSLTNAKSQKPE